MLISIINTCYTAYARDLIYDNNLVSELRFSDTTLSDQMLIIVRTNISIANETVARLPPKTRYEGFNSILMITL